MVILVLPVGALLLLSPVRFHLVFFSCHGLDLSLQTPEAKDGDQSKNNHRRCRGKEEFWVLLEEEVVVGPVGRLQRGVEGTEPDDQRDDGDGVQDQPRCGHRYHRLQCMANVKTAGHSLTSQTIILSQLLVEYSEFLRSWSYQLIFS